MSQQFTVFVVEDDSFYGSMLEYHLQLNPDYTVHRFEDGKSVLDHLYKRPSAITLDYSLPDFSGDEILRRILKILPDVPIIIISGQEDISTAVELLRNGAYDYIVKDENTKDRLWRTLLRIRETQDLKQEISVLREEVRQKYEFGNSIKGESPAMKRIFALLEKAAESSITVSIYGETGTGKEVVAKSIHYNSNRSKKPFVAVNMAAIPRELVESELFGHEKGAFTGAMGRRIGKFEEADGGTLFLDEIGELELTMQAKLLRALQEQEVTRIGSNQVVKFEARIMVATHRNLADEVRAGRFREDLYYRLLGLTITLPPLRERGNDILILAKYFCLEYAKKNKIPPVSLSEKAIKKLQTYGFPGNIRELKAVIDLACVMCENNQIEEKDITFFSLKPERDFLLDELPLKEYTRRIIKHFLEKYDNDVLTVAAKLDIGKSTIYNMLKNNEI